MDNRIIEQFDKHAPFKLDEAYLVVLAKIGSHSHGTYIAPTDPQAIDDVDYMGIVIPPESFVFGINDWEGCNFQYKELDCVFYSFKKFVRLLIKSNPNVLGLLWLKEEFYELDSSVWSELLTNRDLFSSKKAYDAFNGYAYGQFKKMTSFDLETQLKWEDAIAIIEAAGYTKEQIVNKEHREMANYEVVKTRIQQLGYLNHNDPSMLNKSELDVYIEMAINNIIHIHAKHFKGYMGEKRKKLVTKYGYDCKNAAHLIRLMRMCCEFLETGRLNVFRTKDAQELIDIKSGKWTLDAVRNEAERLFALSGKLLKTTSLPDTIDETSIDFLVQESYLSAYSLI